MTVEHIISKVQKLLRLAGANNSPEEAATAAAKAQELIDQHNLTDALLALDTAQPTVGEEVIDFQKAGAPLDSQKTQQVWRVRLASILTRLNGCRIYLSGPNIALVGRPSDAEAVRYLYAYLTRETEQLTENHGKGMGRTWRNNFRLGVVDTLSRKLNEQHRAFETTARTNAGTALVRVNQALAVVEKRGATVDLFMKATLKLRASGPISRPSGNSQAREQGRQAGQSVRIGGGARLGSGAKALKGVL